MTLRGIRQVRKKDYAKWKGRPRREQLLCVCSAGDWISASLRQDSQHMCRLVFERAPWPCDRRRL